MGCSCGALKSQVLSEDENATNGGGRSAGSKGAKKFDDKDAVLAGRINRENFIHEQSGSFDEYYELDPEKLGVGSYGSVYKCTSKATKSVRAVKQLLRTHKRYMDWIRAEAKIMKMMDHPNIIRLFETFEDSKHVYLVMELCAGGGLVERVQKEGGFLSEMKVAILMRQMLRTVSYMHKKGICHRDLKPENFLLLTKDPIERNVLKIIDFGVSCVFENGTQIRDKAGTPYYTSPQVLEGRYTEACDIWSCGVIMYILLCGVPPFPGNNEAEVWANTRHGNFAFQADAWSKVSEDAKNLIRGLMKYKEMQRFTAYEALNHVAIQRYAPRGKDVKLRPSIISSLRNFAFSTKLKKAALHAVVMASREDQMPLQRETFLALDMDDDGFVTHDELSTALSQANLSVPADLEAIVSEVDVSGSGAIDYSEFIAATMDESHYLREERCWAAFLIFDRDGDGKITREELELTLGDPAAASGSKDLAPGPPQAVVELLREADADGDGAINFQEFMQVLKKGCSFDKKPQSPIQKKPITKASSPKSPKKGGGNSV